MAVKVASVEFDLITNVAKYADDMGRAARATEDAAGKMAKSMKKAEDGFKGFADGVKGSLAVGALTAGLIEFGKNLDDQEKGLAQVQASLRSTGGAAGVTEKSILALADSMKKLTAMDDDAIVATDALLLTFTKIGKDIFPQATQAIVDMSVKMGTDLKSATIQVGKALNDPIKGMAALTKVGVSFSDAQKDMVKNLVETGHAMDAQKIILRELETEFGGSAAAMRDTFGGAMQALQVRVGDVFQAIGGGGGLRTAIESLIVVAEKSSAVLGAMNNPASALGKQVEGFNKALGEGLVTGMAWGNALIYGFTQVGAAIKRANDWAVRFMDNYYKLMPGAAAARDMAGGFAKGLGDEIAKVDKTFKDGAASGVVPNYFKGIIDTINEAKKKMADLHAEAAKAKPFVPHDGSESGEGSTKAQIKKLDAERRAVAEIVEKYKLKATQAAEVSKEQRQYNELLEVERQIQKRTLIPIAERKAAIDSLHAAYNQMIIAEKAAEEAKKVAERTKAIANEREGLQGLLDSMREQIAETKAKKTLEESMIPIWEAEQRIKEHTKKFSAENLDLQKQILEAAKQQSELIVQQQHDEALKTLKEITEEYKKELAAAEAKVKGQENYNKLLADEKKIRDDIHLSAEEKDAGVADIKAADAATRTANKTYEAQKKIVKDILASKESDVAKTKKLNDALKAGSINAKEYEDAVADLNNTTSKTSSLGGQLSSIFGNAFNSLISGGSKATDIIKNVGKEIASLAAKKLLLEPLGKMFESWAGGVLGTANGGAAGAGAATQGPSLLQSLGKGLSLFPSAYGAVSKGAANAGGGFISGLGGAVTGAGSWLAKMLGWQTGGSYAGQDAIRVAENGLELVWPGGYGSAEPYLAGLNGPEMYITGGQDGYVSNAYDTQRILRGETNQDIALGKIGDWRQKVQDALASGRPLSYWELQEGNAQAFDTYKRGLDWNSSDELDLAKVMDGIKKAEANAYIENDRNNTDISFNWRAVRANEMSTDGGGFARSVEAGGRALFADGNQQRELINRADALNIPVPDSLRNKGGLMADVWDQQDTISGGTAFSRSFFNLMGTYGGSGYKSMGMSGNNTDVAFGTDQPYDPRNGANGMERADALGAKEWQWQKFHNSNVSYGGGNYVGSSPQQDQNRLSWYKKATSWPGGGVMHPMGPDFNGPNGAGGRDDAAWQRQQNPEGIVPGATYPKGWQAPVYDYGGQVIRSGINGIGYGGAVGAPGVLSTSGDVFDQGNYGSTSQQAAALSSNARMNSPFRNFAEGFGDGQIGARLGAYTGATAPIGGWATKYSGGRASGGRVNAGRLYSVAERGDELFLPEKAGNVIPFDKLRGVGNNQPPVIVRNVGALPDDSVQITNNGGQAVVTLLKAAIQEDPRMNAALASRFGLKPRTALSG